MPEDLTQEQRERIEKAIAEIVLRKGGLNKKDLAGIPDLVEWFNAPPKKKQGEK